MEEAAGHGRETRIDEELAQVALLWKVTRSERGR